MTAAEDGSQLNVRKINIYRHQQEAMNADEFVVAIAGGVGCGKSQYLGYEWLRWMQTEEPRSPGLAVACTHDQLDKAFLHRLKELFEDFGVDFVHGCRPPDSWNVPLRKKFQKWQNLLTCESGHVLVCTSIDRPHYIRGAQYGIALCDEFAFAPSVDALDIIVTRMRCPYTANHKIRIATSPPPDALGWFWQTFISPKKRSGYKVITATSYDNKSLTKEYLERMSQMSEEDRDREVMGLFVPRGTNRCYSEFELEKHGRDKWEWIPGLEVFIGADFNRSPLCWVFAQLDPRTGCLHVFDELFIPHEATTLLAVEETINRFPGSNLVAYPDMTAGFTRTSSVLGLENDIRIMEVNGIQCICPFARNPLQEIRVDAVQERIRIDKLLVNDKCEKLESSLIATMHMPGTRRIKKSRKDGEIGEHPTDALGYLVLGLDANVGIRPLKYGYA